VWLVLCPGRSYYDLGVYCTNKSRVLKSLGRHKAESKVAAEKAVKYLQVVPPCAPPVCVPHDIGVFGSCEAATTATPWRALFAVRLCVYAGKKAAGRLEPLEHGVSRGMVDAALATAKNAEGTVLLLLCVLLACLVGCHCPQPAHSRIATVFALCCRPPCFAFSL
jgi:hypothetical protein